MVHSAAGNAEADWNARYSGVTVYRSSNRESLSMAALPQQADVMSSDVTSTEKLTNATTDHASETIQEVVQFLDENQGQEVGYASRIDSVTSLDSTPLNSALGDFLARPVKIASFVWNESDPVGTSHTYTPWQLFFNDTRIKYKTNNYSFIQCDLKVKVVINASPFYYGAMIMSYQPLQNFSPNGYNSITNDTGTRYFIPYSQRPHMWIYPQSNEGGTMTLPFFLNKNWLRVQKASDFTNMGRITFLNYTTLDSANGATGAGVTVQVFAWAENVRIAGPSVGLAMQTKKEYDGPVSSVASAVAAAAGALKKIPIIRNFATATEMGAMAVRDGAVALGFTNQPVVSDVEPFRPAAIAPMATSEISYPVEKLTLDDKNELTIDPGIVGLRSTDELSICHLAQKESYLTTLSWSTTNVADDILFYSGVTPVLYDTDGTAPIKVYMTPMCWLSYNFAHWRGDIIFRFRFIASPYHKGRVRIIYDPTGYAAENIIGDATSTTAVFNQIVDLGKDTNVEIRIPYQQALGWLQNYLSPSTGNIAWSTSASPSFLYADGQQNGSLVMRVLTQLTAPVATSTIKVMVFVRGADNLEFANPVNSLAEANQGIMYSYLAPQAAVEYSDDNPEEKQQLVAGGVVHSPAPSRYLVNFGEAVLSLRQVLRRACLSQVRWLGSDSTHPIVIFQKTMTKWPPATGYDNYGIDNVKGIITPASNFNFNFSEFHPMQYIMPAFIGTRGSVIWHFNVTGTSPISHIRCERLPVNNAVINEVTTTFAVPTSTSVSAKNYWTTCRAGSSGNAVTNQNTQAGLSVQMPNYSNYKFQSAAPTNYCYAASADGSGYDSALLEIALNGTAGSLPTNTNLWCYAGIGTDFNLLFFLNVPTLFIYASIPVAN